MRLDFCFARFGLGVVAACLAAFLSHKKQIEHMHPQLYTRPIYPRSQQLAQTLSQLMHDIQVMLLIDITAKRC